ncbi:hypothetical protein C9J01_10720 [Photobacterium rosenbergii]|uniref:Uncharacterized protein n=1 Tax=Photobacterium rosenbergii TaxID=294936 RepID=A0A2T3NFF9_9GAMM|nr:hypothetical protein [Photobacterium rosenbergii]PSW13316.1 hypothetical protein C9J01_10720 [Photobacterium rosenbergii]
MKKSAFVIISALVLSSQAMANDVLDYHLSTTGERTAPTTHLIQQANTPAMNVMEAQLTTSGDASMPAGHIGDARVNDSSHSVFEYHYNTAD